MNQLARIKEIIDWRNENIQEEKDATYLAFDSIEQIIQSEETEINDLILENITPIEKFKIICKIKDFNIEEIGSEIYDTIKYYDYEYQDDYIGICAYEDESMEIEDKYYINIDDGLLYSKDNWIKDHMNDYDFLTYEEAESMPWESYIIEKEFDKTQKEFIKLAIKCKVKRIILKYK